MKIALINASPKLLLEGEEPAASAAMLQNVRRILRQHHEHDTEEFHIRTGYLDDGFVEHLLDFDVWLFFFPVYSFSIPAHLLQAMKTLGEAAGRRAREEAKTIRVYAVANGARYDGQEAEHSFTVFEHWADANGMDWGSGLGVGAGPTVMETGFLRTSFSNWRSLGRATTSFVMAVIEGMSAGNFYCTPTVTPAGYVRSFNKYVRKNRRSHQEVKEDRTLVP